MSDFARYPQDRGAVLLLALILLTLLSLLVASALRASTYSVAAAGWSRIEHAVSLAADAALLQAMQFDHFVTDRVVTMPMPTGQAGLRATLSTRYLGRSARIPHRQYDANLHSHLASEYFALRVVVTAASGYTRTHEQLIAVVSPGDHPTNTPVLVQPSLPGSLTDGALLPVARRIIEDSR